MDVVTMYEDQDGRVLSDPFIKLPTRRELPDYYEIIKKPVDITKILNKIDDGKVKMKKSLLCWFMCSAVVMAQAVENCSMMPDGPQFKSHFVIYSKNLHV